MLEKKKKASIQREENKNQKAKTSKQNQGITLIALVVTIVVLLILAGVSIIVLFGDNGMIKTAPNSTLQTKLSEIEERANIAYADLNSKKYAEGNPTKKITMQDVADELNSLKNEKYKVETQSLTGSAIEGIKLNQTNIKLEKGKTENLEATFIYNESGVAYYVKVEEKYYEMSLNNNHITLDKTNGKDKLDGSTEEKGTITAAISDTDVATLETTQTDSGATIQITPGTTIGQVAKITVSYGNLTPATCTVIMKLAPTSDASKPNGNQSPIQNGYGKIDVIWLDENNNIIAEPKAPILQSKANPTAEEKVKMTPVKWNGTGTTATLVDTGVDETNPEITKADGTKEKDWYDYENHRWANAITENKSYFVWIPRYAYRITYYESKEKQETPVGYCDGYGMWRLDGTLEYKLDDGIETVEAQDGNLYIVHPAFGTSNKKEGETDTQYATKKTQNINNGGWGETLTGFWFAKFEMSGETGTELKSSPIGNSVRNKTIGEFYTMGRTASYGQTGTVDSTATDGINTPSFMNSHMVKNSEWGAVAYLTHSKYGLNGEEVAINGPSDNGIGGGTSSDAYLSNQSQSTTANPYGIYDMSGGAYEYTAAFNNTDSEDNFENTSKWTENTKLTTSSNSTKYATKYENNTSNESGNIIYTIGKTGDATKEVYLGIGIKGWFGDYSKFAFSSHPFFERGGKYNYGTLAGVFCSFYNAGLSSNNYSFRAALAP